MDETVFLNPVTLEPLSEVDGGIEYIRILTANGGVILRAKFSGTAPVEVPEVQGPTVEERLTKSESENNKLRQQVSTNDDMLNGLTEYLSEKGLL